MKYSAPPYMHDVLPVEPPTERWLYSPRWRALENIFRDMCRTYGYREIRTPVMEMTELFTRAIGDGTDIVSKEMFTFTDRGGRSMTLRPEGTAPVIRAVLEHGLLQEGTVLKVFYIATIYRYEHGQRGRYREHQQTGVELLGAAEPSADAEVIGLAIDFFRRIGITDAELRLNSVGCPECRPTYVRQLLDYAEPRLALMSTDNQRRFRENPLRMLDSKDPRDHEVLAGAPTTLDTLCASCRAHFDALQSYLGLMGIAFVIDPRLVRGLDYYTRTAFEVVSPQLGAQNVIGGGGRYDGLVEQCGGRPTPGIGFGIGTERCLIVLDQLGVELPLTDETPLVFLVSTGEATRAKVVELAAGLRRAGLPTELDHSGRSLKAQMRHANKLGARWVAIVGEEELASNRVTVKDMSGTQPQQMVAMDELTQFLSTQRHTEGHP